MGQTPCQLGQVWDWHKQEGTELNPPSVTGDAKGTLKAKGF